MVRKRSRTSTSRRNYRKLYESDENESESDLELESPPTSPAPKRYGLRQRKQPIFCVDFDYEDEDELNANNRGSEDEEYNVEVDLNEAKDNHVTIKNFPRRNSAPSPVVSIDTIEPEPDEVSMENGLIDFEDVIRADVVVNKQRVDYDNVINKTEIQIEHLEDKHAKYTKPIKEKGRRGRKPKTKLQLNDTQPAAEGSGGYVENSQDEDTNFEVQIDPLSFVRSDSEDSNPPKSNGVKSDPIVSNESPLKSAAKTADPPVENGSSDIKLGASAVDDIEKFVPPKLDEKEKEVVLSNEYLLGNSFDMSADEFLEKQSQKQDEIEEEEEVVPLINFDDSSSDDDVVIIEKKPEIIVLDDD